MSRPAPELSLSDIAGAERVAGVAFTDGERALMQEGLDEQRGLCLERRAVLPEFHEQPALRFDPRLPGWRPPAKSGFHPSASAALPLPAPADDIAFATVAEQGAWLRAGFLTSERLTRIYLDRIERHAASLFCMATVSRERALADTRRADDWFAAGIDRGPLQGIPWAAKDLIDTRDIVTAWGAEPYCERVPMEDAEVVKRLDEAGAVLLGKTAVGALAYGDLWYGGRCRNPWNLAEGSSGSSAGSAAAVAAGLVSFAIGTETGGSIIAPSLRCGAVGLRPSFGRVSRRGVMPLSWSLDKVGPICRSVEDAALVLHAVNGYDPGDAGSADVAFPYDSSRSIEGLRIGYFESDFDDSEAPALDRSAVTLLSQSGAETVPLQRPDLPYAALRLIMFAEAAAAFEELTLSGRDKLLQVQDGRGWPNEFRKARLLSAVDYVQLGRLRRRVMTLMDDHFRAVDAIVTPAMAGPMLTIANHTGHPGIVLPTGFIESAARPVYVGPPVSVAETERQKVVSVPHGISVVGGLYDEDAMLAVARFLEANLTPRALRPPLFAA